MKKSILVLLFLLAGAVANAEMVRLMIQTASGATYIGNCASYPTAMPVVGTLTAVVSVGTITVPVGAPPDELETTQVTVSSVSQLLTAQANRADLSFYYPTENGTETVWLNPGGAVATPGLGIPLYPGGYWSRDADSVASVPLACSQTVVITAHQGGY